MATSAGHRASGAGSPATLVQAAQLSTIHDPSADRIGRGTRKPGPVRLANTLACHAPTTG
ncbi:hypothetical protein [Fodinicola feengrottensis]|uniref:hypothetical protein n=1 Tax=Fodinicola feengrottensis TaxID=435914 RepID=UPI0013D092EA|nr:hypothetical protein [Fodinicola feengrottensis]